MRYNLAVTIKRLKLSLVLSISLAFMAMGQTHAAQIEVQFDVYPDWRQGSGPDLFPHFTGVLRFESGFDGDYEAKISSSDGTGEKLFLEYAEVNTAATPSVEMYRDGILVSTLPLIFAWTDSLWTGDLSEVVSERMSAGFRDPVTNASYVVFFRFYRRFNLIEETFEIYMSDEESDDFYHTIGEYYLSLFIKDGVPQQPRYLEGSGTFSSMFITETNVPEIACTGFDSPVGDKTVRVRNGRALPLKVKLLDANLITVDGVSLVAPPILSVVRDASEDVTKEANFAGAGTESRQFVYRQDDEIWQFNLKTNNYTEPGTYTVTMVSGDSTEYQITPQCTGTFIVGK